MILVRIQSGDPSFSGTDVKVALLPSKQRVRVRVSRAAPDYGVLSLRGEAQARLQRLGSTTDGRVVGNLPALEAGDCEFDSHLSDHFKYRRMM